MTRFDYSPRFLREDDYKYKVTLPTPHDGKAIRDWLYSNQIPFCYNTNGISYPLRSSIDYFMTTEEHAVLFALRWAAS